MALYFVSVLILSISGRGRDGGDGGGDLNAPLVA
jgi:hypothetical protein